MSHACKHPDVVPKDGTTLAEVSIHALDYANLVTGMRPNNVTPIVMVPSGGCCACDGCVPACGCCTRIPEGFFAIVTSFGAEKGVYEAGSYCLPCWTHVSYLVTKQITVFESPVRDCKTADNVTVHIDVAICFQITDARNFVYNLGPEKLDGLIRAAQEEALRELASSVTHEKVYELQGMDTHEIVARMNEKFADHYGVHILHFTVKDVRLPQDLAETMQKKTIFHSQEINIKKQQDLNMQKMNNDNKLTKIKEEATVEQQNADETQVTNKAKMEKQIAEIKSLTSKELARIEAEADAQVLQIMSDGDLEVAQLQNERDEVSRQIQANLATERNDIIVAAKEYRMNKIQEATLQCAANKADAIKLIAEAEKEAAAQLQNRRKFAEDKATLEVYRGIAKNKSVRIASSAEVGATGMALREDSVSQMVQSAVRYARARFADTDGGLATAPAQQSLLTPLLGKK